jgi:hypothetical protein
MGVSCKFSPKPIHWDIHDIPLIHQFMGCNTMQDSVKRWIEILVDARLSLKSGYNRWDCHKFGPHLMDKATLKSLQKLRVNIWPVTFGGMNIGTSQLFFHQIPVWSHRNWAKCNWEMIRNVHSPAEQHTLFTQVNHSFWPKSKYAIDHPSILRDTYGYYPVSPYSYILTRMAL